MIADGIAMLIGGSGGIVSDLDFSLAAGGNVFVGFLPPRPNQVVAVLPSGGYESDSGLPYDTPSVQIIVRGDEDPRWALDTWYNIYDVLQGLSNVTLPDGTYVVSILAAQSGPVHIGKDENGRFQYGMNLNTEIRNPTVKRPNEL